jgi:hypothetical protein
MATPRGMEPAARAIALAALLFSAPAGAATRPEPSPTPWRAADLHSLVDLHADYMGLANGGMTSDLTFRSDWAPAPYFSLRGDLPLVYAGGGGNEPRFGLGDVMIRPLARVREGRFAVLAGADFYFASATDPALGTGNNRIGPLAVVGYEIAPQKAWVRLQVQEMAPLGGDAKRPGIPSTSVQPMAFAALPEGFWVYTSHAFELRHRGPVRLAYTGTVEIGKDVDGVTLLYADPGVMLTQPWSVSWLFTLGARWVLQ